MATTVTRNGGQEKRRKKGGRRGWRALCREILQSQNNHWERERERDERIEFFNLTWILKFGFTQIADTPHPLHFFYQIWWKDSGNNYK